MHASDQSGRGSVGRAITNGLLRLAGILSVLAAVVARITEFGLSEGVVARIGVMLIVGAAFVLAWRFASHVEQHYLRWSTGKERALAIVTVIELLIVLAV